MLARSGTIPSGGGSLFEPKLDGYPCLVCTHGRFRARSRRGWNMTPLLPELEQALPTDLQLDGELVAFDELGRPDVHLLGERMLHRRGKVRVTYLVFDLLARDGESVTGQPYRERRRQLEALELEGPHARIVPTFADGETLFDAICEHGFEGVVAKRDGQPYRPAERLWVKTRNRAAPRFAEELAGASG